MLRVLSLLLLVIYGASSEKPVCQDYAFKDCLQDEEAEFVAFNTGSQLKCQKHCEIEEECQFYSFHHRPTQNVDCHLFREPFSAYINHCNTRSGPPDDVPSSCLTPKENSCEIEQQENCVMYGQVIESDLDSPSVEICAALCKTNEARCKYWEWDKESKLCSFYDSIDKQCNIIHGPRDGEPGDCSTDPTTATTEGSTASQGTCGITCPPNGMQLFADCENCGGYYECFNGVMTQKPCPNCYLYDIEKEYCNQPTQVSCGDRPQDDNCNAETKPGDCPFDNGYFKDQHNCAKYFICVNGEATSMSCTNATFNGLYDYNLEWCNWEDKVDCEDRPICSEGPPTYKNCQCQGADKVTDFHCPNDSGVQVFIDPFNCQHIIVCQGGNQVQDAFCDDGMYGDEKTGTCVNGDGSICGGRPICRDKKASEDCYCYN